VSGSFSSFLFLFIRSHLHFDSFFSFSFSSPFLPSSTFIMSQEKATHADHIDNTGATVSTQPADTSSLAVVDDGLEHEGTVVYWKSFRFIGSLAAITLMANSLFIGYSMPVNVLSVVDADIGESPLLP
jgi:hypothetical protein